MITILHDSDYLGGRAINWAQAGRIERVGEGAVTCEVAAALIAEGVPPETRVRVVRADPVLGGAPAEVSGLSLALAAKLDVLGNPLASNANA